MRAQIKLNGGAATVPAPVPTAEQPPRSEGLLGYGLAFQAMVLVIAMVAGMVIGAGVAVILCGGGK